MARWYHLAAPRRAEQKHTASNTQPHVGPWPSMGKGRCKLDSQLAKQGSHWVLVLAMDRLGAVGGWPEGGGRCASGGGGGPSGVRRRAAGYFGRAVGGREGGRETNGRKATGGGLPPSPPSKQLVGAIKHPAIRVERPPRPPRPLPQPAPG